MEKLKKKKKEDEVISSFQLTILVNDAAEIHDYLNTK